MLKIALKRSIVTLGLDEVTLL